MQLAVKLTATSGSFGQQTPFMELADWPSNVDTCRTWRDNDVNCKLKTCQLERTCAPSLTEWSDEPLNDLTGHWMPSLNDPTIMMVNTAYVNRLRLRGQLELVVAQSLSDRHTNLSLSMPLCYGVMHCALPSSAESRWLLWSCTIWGASSFPRRHELCPTKDAKMLGALKGRGNFV